MDLNKILAFLAGLLVGIAFGYIVWGAPTPATAGPEITNGIDHRVCICHNATNNPQTICSDWESILEGHGRHWRSGFDELGRCPRPTPTPIPPTPTPEPVYHSLCREYACVQVEGEGDNECEVDEDCQPEVTPIPTEAPKETPFPQPCNGCGEEPKAPTCTGDPDVTVAPINFFITRNGNEAEARWVPTGGSLVNLYYRENDQIGWTHAVRDEVNDGQVIVGGLNPTLGYTFGLQQRFHCGDGMTVTAVVVDPPAWGRTFTTSYFLTW